MWFEDLAPTIQITPFSEEEIAALARFFEKGLRLSNHILRSGRPSHAYLDCEFLYTQHSPAAIRTAHQRLSRYLRELIDQAKPTHLGFIVQKNLPLGIMQFRAWMMEQFDLPTVVVHVDERLLRRQVAYAEVNGVWKPVLSPGSRVLLLTDVTTTGASLYRAAMILNQFGVSCTNAFTLIEREKHAKSALAWHRISLNSLLGWERWGTFVNQSQQANTSVMAMTEILQEYATLHA